uniref:Short chain dehydrogenase/reductase family 42E, member 2 n=1 Tax=Cyprinus carpio carpio TaxID=630221 RepID=A0A9J8C9X9_CYPCA
CHIQTQYPNCVVAARLEGSEQGQHGTGRVLVTGGAGYFGFRLGRALAGQGATVFLLDLHKPPWDIPDGAVFQQIDIRDYDALYKICAGVDVIYHTASYGMSGPEQVMFGWCVVVCTERGISKLIYTSTVNVAFAGRPIEDGDEDSVPCVPLDMHIDHYSRTKAIAERMVLAADGRSTKGGGLLHTCVLRPSGIYGPGERRHLHRVNVERRLFSFCFGDHNAKMNWVHVDNLVMAHVLAADALTADKAFSGQVYFINDGESANVFEWLTPLVSSNQIKNIAVSHTFKIEKAQRELGFSPKKYSLTDSVDQYLRSRPPPFVHPINYSLLCCFKPIFG